MHDNSLQTYFAIRDEGIISGLRLKVLEQIAIHPNQTAGEIALHLGLGLNSSSPRITELYKMGIVVESGIKKINGRSHATWKINTEKTPQLELQL